VTVIETTAVSATVTEIDTVVARISPTSRGDLLFSQTDRRSINAGAPGTTAVGSLDPQPVAVVAALLKVPLATLQAAPGTRLLVVVLWESSGLWMAESAAVLVMIFKRHLLLSLVRNEGSHSPAVEALPVFSLMSHSICYRFLSLI